MGIFSIDGMVFDIPVVSIDREALVLDKYTNRTENGDLQREVLGVYYNYTLSFPDLSIGSRDYEALWNKVTEPVEFHEFVVPGTSGDFIFEGYITVSGDELKQTRNGKHYWGGLSIKLIAKSPARK